MEDSGSSGVGSGFPSKDPGWKYFTRVHPDNKTDLKCNLCRNIFRGGIFRAKQHLAGGYRNAASCKECPSYVREEIQNYINKKLEKAGLSQIVMSDSEDTDTLDNECEELPSLSMCLLPSQKKRRQGTMDMNDEARDVGKKRRQNTTSEVCKKELREKACMSIAKWMCDAAIPFEAVNYPSFQKMLDVISRCGMDFKAPTLHEIQGPCLRKEVAHIENNYIKSCRNEWVKHGCSVMLDCWTDERQRTLINFFVNSPRGSVFFESINASEIANTEERMYALIDKFVEGVGEENVVQVVTNNPSKMVLAGKMLEVKRPHLYWTPCAVHCIDLMLEDIGKLSEFKSTLKKAISVTSYIYDRPGIVKMLRQFAGYKELCQTSATRFSTFLTLEWMLKLKQNLRNAFTSEVWAQSKFSKEADGKKAVKIVLTPSFWNSVLYILKIYGPLVCVLKLVDGERKPPMGYIYEALNRAKETIKKSFQDKEQYRKAFEIIDSRWNCQLHRPLHAAGYYLNPQFFYLNHGKVDGEVNNDFIRVVERLVRDLSDQDKIILELASYRKAEGLFGFNMAIRQRGTMAPTAWWETYGSSTPHLQKFAIKVLSLTCSSSSCEHDWDIFDNVHAKKGNMLVQQCKTDLLFVKYNRALKRQHDACYHVNPVSLKEIDECNEWLVGSMSGEDGENELGDDMTLAVVARALPAYRTRKKNSSTPASNSSAKAAKDPKQAEKGKRVRGSSLRLIKEEDEEEKEEKEEKEDEDVEFDEDEEEEEYISEDLQFDEDDGEDYDDEHDDY
ncbi:hypothetical protein ACS0TY_025559 [Phlomoides rotata]